MDVKLAGTSVFRRLQACKAREVVCYGGAGSSKSYSMAQRSVTRLITCKDWRQLVMRKTFPALRDTAMQTVVDILIKHNLMQAVNFNKSTSTMTFGKNQILFRALDKAEKIKSFEANEVWLEEGNEFSWKEYIRIVKRGLRRPSEDDLPNQSVITMNPETPNHWVKQNLIDTGDAAVIHSTYHDNPFADHVYRANLEKLKEIDYDSWLIFAKGEFAELRNLIYKAMLIEPWPESFETTIYGVDFGFTAPSIVVELNIIHGEMRPTICIRPIIEKKGLTNADLISKLKEKLSETQLERPFYCDTAEPARIAEMQQAGISAVKSDKSVKDGIDFCKRVKFISRDEYAQMNREWASYKYRTDKDGEIIDDEPHKKNDHYPDAIRYAAYTHLSPIYNLIPTITVGRDAQPDYRENQTPGLPTFHDNAEQMRNTVMASVGYEEQLDPDDETLWDHIEWPWAE